MTLTLDRRASFFPIVDPHPVVPFLRDISDLDGNRETVQKYSITSHLSDLRTILDRQDSCTESSSQDHHAFTAHQNTVIMPLQRPPYDFPSVDDQSRDLHSDLFLLDQAMQPSPNAPSDIDPTEELFNDALSRPTPPICPSLFEDMVGHSKLLCLDNTADTIAVHTEQYSTNLRSIPQVAGVSANLTSVSQKGVENDTSQPESTDLDSILHQLGIIGTPNSTDNHFTQFPNRPSHNMRSMQSHHPQDPSRYFKDPHSQLDIHQSTGNLSSFGKQRKRRLSTLTPEPTVMNSDNCLPVMAKRAKTDMHGSHRSSFTEAVRYGLSTKSTYRSSTVGRGDLRSFAQSNGTLSARVHPNQTECTRPHADLYENLTPELQARVDHLREKIAKMPRRKLRESLAKGVSIEEVQPLMSINRDDLAEMLGLGVTTWKIFIHHTFGIPRWPARVLKSEELREKNLRVRLEEAEGRGNAQEVADIYGDLRKLQEKRRKGRNHIRAMARKCREKIEMGLEGRGHGK